MPLVATCEYQAHIVECKKSIVNKNKIITDKDSL